MDAISIVGCPDMNIFRAILQIVTRKTSNSLNPFYYVHCYKMSNKLTKVNLNQKGLSSSIGMKRPSQEYMVAFIVNPNKTFVQHM